MPTNVRAKCLLGAAAVALAPAAFGVATFATMTAANAQESAGEANDEIIITGSRIPRTDLEGASPVAIFDSAEITRTGVTSIGKLLREIPSVAGQGQTTTVNNGGTGSQNVALRGLESYRTLVLINGRRVVGSGQGSASTGIEGTVDLNTIPVSMIERVEVLKDGASAVYGADAVAGVVNVILKSDFEGVQLDAYYGQSGESDGDTEQYSLTFGDKSETSNYIFNLSRVVEDPVGAGDRAWSEDALIILEGQLIPGGSSAPPWGRYFTPSGPSGGLTLGPEYAGAFRAFDSSTDLYNFAPSNFQRQANERWSMNFSGSTEFAPLTDMGPFGETRLFAEASYVDRQSLQKLAEVPLAPLAFFGFDAPYSADNAYNPFGEEIGDWRRRMVESGSRTENVNQSTVRFVAGLEGDFAGGWDWDLAYGYGETQADFQFGPIFDLDRVALAVGPTALDGDGAIRCDTNADGVFTDADDDSCVPLNVFGENSVTQEMTDYIAIRTNESGGYSQEYITFSFSNGELFSLPAGPVGIAGGFEWREEKGFDQPDSIVVALGDSSTGTPREPTSGGYDVTEYYLETIVPILSGAPLAELLEIDAAVRFSDYSSFGDTTNWKVGARWRPVEDLLVRGTVSTAFRAPNISELFGAGGISFPTASDPCLSDPTQFCIDDGVLATGGTAPSGQVRAREGGRADVEPEEADIFTAGLVYTPSVFPGVAMGLDYYDIEIENAIGTFGTGRILQQCQSDGSTCGLIDRFTTGPNIGAPTLVRDFTTNVGDITTSGVDFFAEWMGIDSKYGEWGFKFQGTYVNEYDKTIGDDLIPHAGFFRDEDDGHFAKWRMQFTTQWAMGPLSASADVRYIDGVTEYGEEEFFGPCADPDGTILYSASETVGTCINDPNSINFGRYERDIEEVYYLDMQIAYDFDFGPSSNQVYFGIDNVLDEEPPLSTDGFNDNTDVRTYDTLGRFFYIGVRSNF